MLCKTCGGGECQDDKGIAMDCPNCNGTGCENCTHGQVDLVGCPQSQMDAETRETVRFADWIDKGFLPCSGGVVDQSASLMASCRFFDEEKNRIENAKWTKQST